MRIESNLLTLSPHIVRINPQYAQRQFTLTQLEKDLKVATETQLVAPIIVRSLANNEFELVAGHRRLVVAQQANLKEISCLVFADDEQLIQPLQLLDWIHDVGEHVILRHPDAYAYYFRKKAELLKRQLPPELEDEKKWNDFIHETLVLSIEAMLNKLFGEQQKEIISSLLSMFEEYNEYSTTLNVLKSNIASESFKIALINNSANAMINLLKELLRLEASEDLSWVDNILIDLTTPPYAIYTITQAEATQVLDLDQLNLTIYRRRVANTINANVNSGLITQKGKINQRIGRDRTLTDGCNYQFSFQFRDGLMTIIRDYPGARLQDVFSDIRFTALCHMDFLQRLQIQFKMLYDKLRHDESQIIIDDAYIDNCFTILDIENAVYRLFQLDQTEGQIINIIRTTIKNLFINKVKNRS